MAVSNNSYRSLAAIFYIAKTASKEKILRVSVAICANFVRISDSSLPVLIGMKALEFLETFEGKKLADEELSKDMEFLKQKLYLAYQNLNSFDEYFSEVKSGNLEWSPPHKSDLFWRENVHRLNDNNYEVLRLLSDLLDPQREPFILAIAANDIGMYLEHFRMGAKVIDEMSIKPKIMNLISHSDPDVRYRALTVMQIYMKCLWKPVC